jgi:hypothetical protein
MFRVQNYLRIYIYKTYNLYNQAQSDLKITYYLKNRRKVITQLKAVSFKAESKAESN